MINPLKDGIDHINIYSKGKTELGRLLSNFANTPIAINGTRYQCLEGYWYDRGIAWPKHQEMVVIGDKRLPITSFTKSPEIEKEHKSLQTANGFKAKEIGKALREKYGIAEDLSFQQAIGFAMEAKIQQHPKIAQLLKDSSLPFEHYYVYEDVVRDAGFKWILEKWMEIRDKLQAPDAKDWLDKHQDLFSSIPDQVLPNERKVSGTTQKETSMTRQYFGTITLLKEHEVFVFGSNNKGFHGAGAAGMAMRANPSNNWRADDKFLRAMKAPIGHPDRIGHWAVFGVGRGFQKGLNGESYAIATVTEPGKRRSISLDEIFSQMKELEQFALSRPEKTFFCAINGGGYNGYSVEEIRSLYNKWNPPYNIHFPEVMKQEEAPVAKRYYAGIGSRQTPPDVLAKMTQIATALAKKGYVLRSGGAQGADRAFESGAVDKEIFRPEGAPNWAMKLVQKYVPASYKWNTFKLYTKQLQGRNMQILLGENGDSPVEFVICWTPDGKDSGGTGYGLRCAVDKGIPVFNLKNEGVLEQFRTFYKNL